ncbi:MAG: hypothetical protein IJ718_02025 [Paludibacteraceae bacterium]|nr:hypothetical protein [Paludibacteraceae bacterium]
MGIISRYLRRRRHHRHRHHSRYGNYNVKKGASFLNWKRDKKMILGIIFGTLFIIWGCLFPARGFIVETYNLLKIWLRPETEYDEEIKIDPIRTDYKLRLDRERVGDSVAAATGADTLRKEIRQRAIPVYRPPRPRNTWYLSEKDMQELRRGAENRFETKEEQ